MGGGAALLRTFRFPHAARPGKAIAAPTKPASSPQQHQQAGPWTCHTAGKGARQATGKGGNVQDGTMTAFSSAVPQDSRGSVGRRQTLTSALRDCAAPATDNPILDRHDRRGQHAAGSPIISALPPPAGPSPPQPTQHSKLQCGVPCGLNRWEGGRRHPLAPAEQHPQARTHLCGWLRVHNAYW